MLCMLRCLSPPWPEHKLRRSLNVCYASSLSLSLSLTRNRATGASAVFVFILNCFFVVCVCVCARVCTCSLLLLCQTSCCCCCCLFLFVPALFHCIRFCSRSQRVHNSVASAATPAVAAAEAELFSLPFVRWSCTEFNEQLKRTDAFFKVLYKPQSTTLCLNNLWTEKREREKERDLLITYVCVLVLCDQQNKQTVIR